MPCDSIQTVSVLLSPQTDGDLLEKALAALNMQPHARKHVIFFGQDRRESFNKDTGELRVRSSTSVPEIKRAYSAEIVKAQAKKYGWTLKETGAYQYQVTKR